MMFALALALSSRHASAEPIKVPVDVAVGPAILSANADAGLGAGLAGGFTAVELDVEAIIGPETLKKARKKVPKRYRKYVPKSEVRVRPSIFIPDLLIVSPARADAPNTLWGMGWTPIAVNVPFIKQKGLRLDASVGLTGVVALAEVGDASTVLARPGLRGLVELEAKVAPRTFLSVGYDARALVPQDLNGSAPGGDTWMLGGPFAQLHVRFPYTVDM
ncbi:MAG: hypothetical protein RLZZ299_550 [Pseudomonadota bacterium]